MIRMLGSSMKRKLGPSKVVGYSNDDQDCCGTNDLGHLTSVRARESVAPQLAWWNWTGTRVFQFVHGDRCHSAQSEKPEVNREGFPGDRISARHLFLFSHRVSKQP
jgi:hypothetical protein